MMTTMARTCRVTLKMAGSVNVMLAIVLGSLSLVALAAHAEYQPPEQDPPRGGTTTSGMELNGVL
jgi:hypothetical protein